MSVVNNELSDISGSVGSVEGSVDERVEVGGGEVDGGAADDGVVGEEKKKKVGGKKKKKAKKGKKKSYKQLMKELMKPANDVDDAVDGARGVGAKLVNCSFSKLDRI